MVDDFSADDDMLSFESDLPVLEYV